MNQRKRGIRSAVTFVEENGGRVTRRIFNHNDKSPK